MLNRNREYIIHNITMPPQVCVSSNTVSPAQSPLYNTMSTMTRRPKLRASRTMSSQDRRDVHGSDTDLCIDKNTTGFREFLRTIRSKKQNSKRDVLVESADGGDQRSSNSAPDVKDETNFPRFMKAMKFPHLHIHEPEACDTKPVQKAMNRYIDTYKSQLRRNGLKVKDLYSLNRVKMEEYTEPKQENDSTTGKRISWGQTKVHVYSNDKGRKLKKPQQSDRPMISFRMTDAARSDSSNVKSWEDYVQQVIRAGPQTCSKSTCVTPRYQTSRKLGCIVSSHQLQMLLDHSDRILPEYFYSSVVFRTPIENRYLNKQTNHL